MRENTFNDTHFENTSNNMCIEQTNELFTPQYSILNTDNYFLTKFYFVKIKKNIRVFLRFTGQCELTQHQQNMFECDQETPKTSKVHKAIVIQSKPGITPSPYLLRAFWP